MTPRQHASDFMKFSRKISLDMLKGIPDDKCTFQPCPTDNHVLWVLGHLASTDVWIAGVVGAKGVTVPEPFAKLFGQGSKPEPSSKSYPSLAEVRRAFDSTRDGVLNWFDKAGDQDLAQPLGDKTGGFAGDPIDAMLKIAWHEGWHFGQVASVRKALHLPPVLG